MDFLDATRRSYDATADDYAEWIRDELAAKPFDRAVLGVFAELVRGPVADVGCGTGRITAHLAGLGVDVSGVDLSPRMLAAARRTYPHLSFAEASMTALPIEDGALGGVVAWYSTIHVPGTHLPAALAEFHRVLRPGGLLQLAFQSGTGTEHRTRAGRHDVELTFHHRTSEKMADLLRDSGFTVRAQLVRAPDTDGPYPEETPQAYLLACAHD
ncbi:class I SAM-dependent methyltransferase [Actinophytocola sp. NPDC049390]|uniref:class I SAM-dependent methyltransferase n=1 Tax=Actinophytocola sp. NPDC049390 TaxID=3363894 RepID=UPI00379A8F56